MDCELIETPLPDGRAAYSCPHCAQISILPRGFAHARRVCQREAPPPGPGRHLHWLIEELAIRPDNDCGCLDFAAQMDAWGVVGCRAHRAEIVARLKLAFKKIDWVQTMVAYRKLRQADWFRYLDPFGSIVDEAIRRAKRS